MEPPREGRRNDIAIEIENDLDVVGNGPTALAWTLLELRDVSAASDITRPISCEVDERCEKNVAIEGALEETAMDRLISRVRDMEYERKAHPSMHRESTP